MATIETAGGVRLHVHDSGAATRRPLVLVHGWSLSHRAFSPQIAALSDRFRVIAPDLRGHGLSAAAPRCSLQDFAGDLEAVLATLDLRGAVLAGWSWGAEVVLAALPAVAGRVAAVALLSATPRFTSTQDWPHGLPEARVRALRARFGRSPDATRRAFVEGMFAEGELSAADRTRIVEEQLALAPDAAAARATLDALGETDLRPCLGAAARFPALLVHGDQDGICLPAASAWIAERLPTARRIVLAGAGHAPQLSRDAEVSALLADFAESLP